MQSNMEFDPTKVRQYLLGALSEDARVALEAEYFADRERFEQVWALENDLVDEYVRGRLPPSERALFERHYLASPRHQQRVAVARQLSQAAAAAIETTPAVNNASSQPSWWSNLLALFQLPQFALGSAVALMLLMFGGWWFWRTISTTPERIAQMLPTPVLSPAPSIASPSATPTPSVQPSASVRPDASAVLAFTLVGAVVRDGGKIQTLKIPTDTKQVQLNLKLAGEEYPQYQIQLRTSAGKELLTQTKLKPAVNRKSVTVRIPGKQLPQGDYFLALSGVSADNEAEELVTYFFRVTRK